MKKREKRNRVIAGIVVAAIVITFISSAVGMLINMF